MTDGNAKNSMLPVGTLLHGTYRIERYLGSGGFGNTYMATNTAFNESVAIKEFYIKGVCERGVDSTIVSISNSDNINSFAQQLEKFKKEARRLRSINNVHVVKVYDLFEENGTAYYVMDFINGESLSERMKRTMQLIPEGEVMGILMQVLDGLKTIHENNILHLDLKPGNIMIDGNNRVCLIDFGASKQQDVEGGATSSTGVSYTTGYAPLEQMSKEFKNFGPWTDFYALGATMYKMLTLSDPPSVSSVQDDITQDKSISLPMPGVSLRTKNLILWMMSPRLARPRNVDAILNYLGIQQQSASDETVSLNNGSQSFSSMGNKTNSNEETVVDSSHNSSNNINYDGNATNWTPNRQKKKSDDKFLLTLVGVIFAAVIIFIGVAIYIGNSNDDYTEDYVDYDSTVVDYDTAVVDCDTAVGYEFVDDTEPVAAYSDEFTDEGSFD